MDKEKLKKIIILISIFLTLALICSSYSYFSKSRVSINSNTVINNENNNQNSDDEILEESEETQNIDGDQESESKKENNSNSKYSDEDIKRFQNYMNNVKEIRNNSSGVFKDATIELELNKTTDVEGYNDKVKLVINKSGDARLAIDNFYLEERYGKIYPHVANDAVDVIAGSRPDNISQFFYILNADGTITRIRILDELTIVEEYKDLEYIIKLEKRQRQDSSSLYYCYDINGNIYEL